MNKIYTREIKSDDEGYYILIPDEICSELDLNDCDVMVWEISDNKIILKKRLDYI